MIPLIVIQVLTLWKFLRLSQLEKFLKELLTDSRASSWQADLIDPLLESDSLHRQIKVASNGKFLMVFDSIRILLEFALIAFDRGRPGMEASPGEKRILFSE